MNSLPNAVVLLKQRERNNKNKKEEHYQTTQKMDVNSISTVIVKPKIQKKEE